jgi:hypothetical protein
MPATSNPNVAKPRLATSLSIVHRLALFASHYGK